MANGLLELGTQYVDYVIPIISTASPFAHSMQNGIKPASVVDGLLELDAILRFARTLIVRPHRLANRFLRLVDLRRWEHKYQG